MTQLSSHSNLTTIRRYRRSLTVFILLYTVFSFSIQPISAEATSENDFTSGVSISTIDVSKLSPNNRIVTVWIENQDNTPSGELILDLNYLLFPTSDHGKSWHNLNQLNFSSELEGLAILQLQGLAPGEVRAVDISVRPDVVATLKRIPGIFIGEIYLADHSTLLSHQIGFAIPKEISMIHATALAFDNPNYAAGNLAPQIEETVSGIVEASELNTEVFSIILFDDFGESDTQVYFVYAGTIIPARSIILGLPDSNGKLLKEISEYDMGDGETLGGYLKWVRQTTDNHKLAFSFYGHGGALMPDIAPQPSSLIEVSDLNGDGPITMPSWIAIQPSWIAIQPSWIAIQPSWIAIQPSWIAIQPSEITAEESFATDSHPLSLISIKDLSVALKKGSNDGENPIDIVDLVHCFSLSIEEVYELAPYTKSIIGSANYHFFDARMPGQALANIEPSESAENIATSIMTTYDHVLPSEGYPRTMAVINSDHVADIKTYWDQTSAALMTAFANNHQATRTKLQQAYEATTKYDSTSCDNELSLKSPDALVDFYEFSSQLQRAFSDDPAIVQAAQSTSTQIDSAVSAVINRSGSPWFSTSTDDNWQFTGKGLSVYADLAGQPDGSGRYILSWQSAFYNRVPHPYSPSPFDFIASENDTVTWADVLLKSWEGFEVSAQSCPINVPQDRDQVEVSVSNVSVNALNKSDPKNIISAEVYVDQQLGNLIVLFEIIREGQVVYSEQVHTGWLNAGYHTISSSVIADNQLLESISGDTNISVKLDPNNYILEENKVDNQLSHLIQP